MNEVNYFTPTFTVPRSRLYSGNFSGTKMKRTRRDSKGIRLTRGRSDDQVPPYSLYALVGSRSDVESRSEGRYGLTLVVSTGLPRRLRTLSK